MRRSKRSTAFGEVPETVQRRRLWFSRVPLYPGGEVTPRGRLIRLTRRLPVELASQLLSVLDGGPALLRAEAVCVLEVADPRDPATPPWP